MLVYFNFFSLWNKGCFAVYAQSVKGIKKREKTTGISCKPILSKTLNSRGQMDLIDMQTCPDGEYKQLLVYQDLGAVEIGDFVVLPIPDVDRSVSSAPNLICRIVDIDYQYNVHELECEAGVLSVMFARKLI